MLTIYDWVPRSLVESRGWTFAGTPEAAHVLNSRGIKYIPFEGLEKDSELLENEDRYFHLQLDWFRRLDSFIQSQIPFAKEYGIDFAYSNYLRIKYILDTCYLRARLAQRMIEMHAVSEVHVCSYNISYHDYSIYDFSKLTRPIFYQALQEMCYRKNIRIFFHGNAQPQSVTPSKITDRMPLLKNTLKSIQYIFKYRKTPFLSLPDAKKILFMHAGSHDVDELIRSALRAGQDVYTEDNSGIYREGFFRSHSSYPKADINRYKNMFETAAANWLDADMPFYEFYNSECRDQTGQFIKPWIAAFIRSECLKLSEKMFACAEMLKRLGIDFVCARGNTDLDSAAMLLAARKIRKLPAVCVQHASCGLRSDSMLVYDTNTYDLTLARDVISAAGLRESERVHNLEQHPIVISPHYLKLVAKKFLHKKNGVTAPLKILYAEKKFAGFMRCYTENMYPLTGYYEFQLHLIRYFSSSRLHYLVYKHAPGQVWAEQSLFKDIEALKSEFISISSRNFLKEMKKADRVIVDYPSGALFEAAAAGKPVLCVYPDYFKINSEAQKRFGKSLQPFKKIEEAIMHIDAFLKAPAEEYVVRFPFDGSEIPINEIISFQGIKKDV